METVFDAALRAAIAACYQTPDPGRALCRLILDRPAPPVPQGGGPVDKLVDKPAAKTCTKCGQPIARHNRSGVCSNCQAWGGRCLDCQAAIALVAQRCRKCAGKASTRQEIVAPDPLVAAPFSPGEEAALATEGEAAIARLKTFLAAYPQPADPDARAVWNTAMRGCFAGTGPCTLPTPAPVPDPPAVPGTLLRLLAAGPCTLGPTAAPLAQVLAPPVLPAPGPPAPVRAFDPTHCPACGAADPVAAGLCTGCYRQLSNGTLPATQQARLLALPPTAPVARPCRFVVAGCRNKALADTNGLCLRCYNCEQRGTPIFALPVSA